MLIIIRNDKVGKVFHLELCKRLKFDNTDRWYIHKLESVPENEIHNTFWVFEIQTEGQKKRTCYLNGFCRPS